jgi:hypothetical protein
LTAPEPLPSAAAAAGVWSLIAIPAPESTASLSRIVLSWIDPLGL